MSELLSEKSTGATQAPRIAAATTTGPVALNVRDLAGVAAFYQRTLGLAVQAEDKGTVVLGAAGGVPLVTLVEAPAAVAALPRSAGLYHLAILLPGRADLGRWLTHMAESRTPIDGAADHLVSEAVYLADPEGNGIEVYRDRPRLEWPLKPGGGVRMDNARLDIDGLLGLARAEGTPWQGAPAGTRMGHIHLKVTDIPAARDFYVGRLGLDAMETMPSALFVAAGGYHHHLGLNTWHSGRGTPLDPAALGLSHAVIEVPDAAELGRLADDLAAHGVAVARPMPGTALVRDPSGNRLLFTAGPVDAATAAGFTAI
ncbi:VOC family protein [Methylobrevis albus]|uniref:VOC family protein n=1 Tax=Methylobrevis albus TaxID=2793297 RepID=A0A931MZR6_9HYPH|nr:VOC family protein [Methylobrevis albus]MBH0239290.1 VOC family protein [Methylobrevis albus]